jgi:predicted permease
LLAAHPAAELAFTVYTVVTLGVTATVLVVALLALALQVYVLPPLAVIVVVTPLHKLEGLAVKVNVGVVLTVTVAVVEFVQAPFDPLNV